jgi:hypothetical protein
MASEETEGEVEFSDGERSFDWLRDALGAGVPPSHVMCRCFISPDDLVPKERKFVAIFDERKNDYVWHSVRNRYMPVLEEPLPEGCTETAYVATGRYLSRGDGNIAEIFEERGDG